MFLSELNSGEKKNFLEVAKFSMGLDGIHKEEEKMIFNSFVHECDLADYSLQKQDNIDHFCEKISEGKKAQVGNNFMIIARIESLILKQGLDDALERAAAYINAGADGIMIHSKEKTPDEVLAFCKRYNDLDQRVPLVAVPTSYSQIKEEQLIEAGVNIVIYANHLLRSAYPAMVKTAKSILYHQRAKEASENCLSIKEILTLIPGGK